MRGTDLSELQRLLVDAVMRPAAPPADAPADRVARLLRPSARGMTAESRLEVYRDQFWLRHLASLAEDFPTVRWVVGEASFDGLLHGYLRDHPPRGWNLQRLGADFPAFVDSRRSPSDDALAHDAALIDWAFMEVFDAPDSPPLDLRVIAAAPPDAWPLARISFLPALRHVGTAHIVHALRGAIKKGEACERPPRVATRTVVWRDAAHFLHALPVDLEASQLMLALQGGQPLGEACASVAAANPAIGAEVFDTNVGVWFQQWTANGWLSAVDI
jgi:hypothetical protein